MKVTSLGGDLVCAVGGRQRICIPENYQKYDLPLQTKPTFVTIGVDIKDIPKVSDKDFSITLNAYFNVKWRDPRLLVSKDYSKEGPLPDVSMNENLSFSFFYSSGQEVCYSNLSTSNLGHIEISGTVKEFGHQNDSKITPEAKIYQVLI